jgi:MHS family proline/betaine transporter-like MFS transporter
MTSINHLSQQEAFSINTLALTLLIILIPIFGILSDYINKISLMLIASISFAIMAFPYFWYISFGSYSDALTLQLLAAIPSACFFSLAPTLIAETFPTEVRCTAFSLIYQTVASLAAGLTPLILLHLSRNTHTSPAWLLVGSAIFGGIYLHYAQHKFQTQPTANATESL